MLHIRAWLICSLPPKPIYQCVPGCRPPPGGRHHLLEEAPVSWGQISELSVQLWAISSPHSRWKVMSASPGKQSWAGQPQHQLQRVIARSRWDVTSQICPPRFLFCGSQYLQATPWSQAHAYQSSSQPEIIYDLAFREEKQFSRNVWCHDI